MRGFTMIELMVVVSIMIVMIGTLAPSFGEFLASQQAKGLSYDLTADLMLARNEALKRNASVSIARGDTGWDQGWTVATVATHETLSRRNPAAKSVNVSGAPAAITFDVNGRVASPVAAVRITISSSSSSRCVELDLAGRVRTQAGACT
jgi:type IV fimbrial biogenesis protein FimT